MIFEKIFEVTIIVTNPINFCINKKYNILTELDLLYLNKCYMGVFIIKILDILQMSTCKIISSNSSGNGIIDVKFSAEVYVLNKWDILVGIEIEKNQSLIIGNYKRNDISAIVTFKPTYIQANDLQTKQLVPVRIVQAIHSPKHEHIVAAGVLLTCDRNAITYKVRGEIAKSSINEIQYIFNAIKKELEMRMILMKEKEKDILFFESLLYSYKKYPNKFNKIEINNELNYHGFIDKEYVNIFSLLDKDLTGSWSRPLKLSKSAPCIEFLEEKTENHILSSPELMILDISKNILTYLIAIREFTEIYNTPELITKHENIWNLMRQAQV